MSSLMAITRAAPHNSMTIATTTPTTTVLWLRIWYLLLHGFIPAPSMCIGCNISYGSKNLHVSLDKVHHKLLWLALDSAPAATGGEAAYGRMLAR
jgi:hypothetical protein